MTTVEVLDPLTGSLQFSQVYSPREVDTTGVYGDLTVIYRKSYSIHLKGTISYV